MKFLVLTLLVYLCLSCKQQPHISRYEQTAIKLGKPELAPLLQKMDAIKPLHTPMGKPKLFDWLSEHAEQGQTFAEYLNCNPLLPDKKRNILYVQPIGKFSEPQRQIVKLAADYLSRFFNLPVKIQEDVPLSRIPTTARRASPFEKGEEQLLTGYLLNELLKPHLPDDAVAMIGFTSSDLWPGQGWNFVFGQATLTDRVGVWSINRFGNPDYIYGDFQLCLLRTLKIASHETGHMFSMTHCTKYECNLSGSNHLGETDSRPLDVCPECTAKICWAMNYAPELRYQRLAEFCQQQGLTPEQKYFASALKTIQRLPR